MTPALSRAFGLALLGIAVAAGVASAAPALTAVEPTPDGYVLVGREFGTAKSKVQVFEDASVVPPSAVISVTDNRITVRSKPTGTVAHRVVVGSQSTAPLRHQHAAAPAAPVIARVEPGAQGYALVGRNFGADRSKVQVFEGATDVTARVQSVAPNRIVVKSSPTGAVDHKVVVAGQASAAVKHTHAAGASSGGPMTKSLTLGTLSAMGPGRAAPTPPKSLTLGTLSATGPGR